MSAYVYRCCDMVRAHHTRNNPCGCDEEVGAA